jgi:hypothetical protein
MFLFMTFVGQLAHNFLIIGEECAQKYLGITGFNAYIEKKVEENKAKADKISNNCTGSGLDDLCKAAYFEDPEWYRSIFTKPFTLPEWGDTATSHYYRTYSIIIVKTLMVIEAELNDRSNKERFGMAWLDELQLINMFDQEGNLRQLEDRENLRKKVKEDNERYDKEMAAEHEELMKKAWEKPYAGNRPFIL